MGPQLSRSLSLDFTMKDAMVQRVDTRLILLRPLSPMITKADADGWANVSFSVIALWDCLGGCALLRSKTWRTGFLESKGHKKAAYIWKHQRANKQGSLLPQGDADFLPTGPSLGSPARRTRPVLSTHPSLQEVTP